MKILKVRELLDKRALVTRASAREIGEALAGMVDSTDSAIVLDFADVDAVAPSFVDELLFTVYESLQVAGRKQLSVIFSHPPTRLSSKFAAIARARFLKIVESTDGDWIISAKQQS